MKRKQILALAVAGTLLFGVTNATSSYIHEVAGTISICDPSSNGTKCITMQETNLGATTNDTNSTGVLGNHYQWGNNYGFTIGCYQSNCSDTETINATTGRAEWDISYNNYGYNGPITNFMKLYNDYDYWGFDSHYDGLWGGANDSQANNWGYDESGNVALNVENRRGPCGEGYHVPSIGEWNQVLKYWAEENGVDLYDENGLKYNFSTLDGFKFQDDFKLPPIGRRDRGSAKVINIGSAMLWSSSPNVGDGLSYGFIANGFGADSRLKYARADAHSVRCFKNSYLEFPSSEGGGDSLITVNIAALNNGQNTCTLDNYIFSGIFASPSVVFKNISQSMHCVFGDAGSKAVTLELSGNLTDGSGNIIPGGNVRLKNSAWTATPAGIQTGNTAIAEYTGLNKTITLFNKVANKIGEATGAGVDIQIEVPGGTPNGVYNGVLVLSY